MEADTRALVDAIHRRDWEAIRTLAGRFYGHEPISPEEQDDPLWAAIRVGDAEAVRLLLAAGADASGHNVFTSPVIQATTAGHPEIMKLLLDAGADPNAPGDDGWTALFSCSSAIEAQMLIEAGGDVNARCDFDYTASQWHADPEILEVLFQADAPMNPPDDNSPLKRAIDSMELGTVEYLLARGRTSTILGGGTRPS